MKKEKKRLVLSPERLRTLTVEDLAHVGGGTGIPKSTDAQKKSFADGL